MLIQNKSVSRTIVHSEGGEYYRIDPLTTSDIPDEIAEQILSGWPEAQVPGKEKPNLPETPWEYKCGDIWKRAKAEFNLTEKSKPVETIGPDRPEVVEPVQVDDGSGEKNKHICPTCEQEFPTLKGVRLHQRKKHLA